MTPLKSNSSIQVLAFRQEYEGCALPDLVTALIRNRNRFCQAAIRELLAERRAMNPAGWQRYVDQLGYLSNDVLVLLGQLGNPFVDEVLAPALN